MDFLAAFQTSGESSNILVLWAEPFSLSQGFDNQLPTQFVMLNVTNTIWILILFMAFCYVACKDFMYVI